MADRVEYGAGVPARVQDERDARATGHSCQATGATATPERGRQRDGRLASQILDVRRRPSRRSHKDSSASPVLQRFWIDASMGRPRAADALARSASSCSGVGHQLDSKLEVSQPAVRAPAS